MFAIASLSVHPDTLYQLLDYLRESGSPLNAAEAADQAVHGTRLRVTLRYEHAQPKWSATNCSTTAAPPRRTNTYAVALEPTATPGS